MVRINSFTKLNQTIVPNPNSVAPESGNPIQPDNRMPRGTDMLLNPGQGKGSGFLLRLRGMPVDSRKEGRLSSIYSQRRAPGLFF